MNGPRWAGPSVVVAALALAAPAAAMTPTITEFAGGASPAGIASGSDSNLWFGDPGAAAFGRITTSGSITEFPAGLPAGSKPSAVALGPDGNIWFTDKSTPAIGRIDPAGNVAEFTTGLPSGSVPAGIARGPDGNMWFTDAGTPPAVGRVTPAGQIQEFALPVASKPAGIVAGPDGNLWVADAGTPPAIRRVTPSGDVQRFSAGLDASSRPSGIAAGPDGNLWFTDRGTPAGLGRITTAGTIDEFRAGLNAGARPDGIATGPDGALWFADPGSSPAIGRIATDGSILEFASGLAAGSSPAAISPGPDGNMWFTDAGTSPAIGVISTPPAAVTFSVSATTATRAAVLGTVDGHQQRTWYHVDYGLAGGSLRSTHDRGIGVTIGPTHVSASITRLSPSTTYQARLVAVNDTGESPGALVTFTTPPPADRISRLHFSPRRMIAAARGGTFMARKVKPRPKRKHQRAGATISYVGTQPAVTTFTIRRYAGGRRVGSRCVAVRRSNRRLPRCTRLSLTGTFRRRDVAGVNRFRFSGRLHNRKLKRASYQLTVQPRSAGGVGRSVRIRFSVKR